jgi:hypothetical protein
MKKLISFAALATLAFAASAADVACDAQAVEKKLAGAAKTSFLKKCNADHPVASNPACDAKAAEKKLAGAAKTSYVKKCTSDGGPDAAAAAPATDAAATCATKSAEKKLAGAAKTSFEKKCVADAAAK